MRQIAKEGGVQAGALYNYTPDKQSLLFSLMSRHMEELQAAWDAVPRAAGAMDRLRAFTGFHIRFHLERPEAVCIAYMLLRNLTEENFTGIDSLRRDY
jgi:AcrR family transcriptional regulator